MAVANETVIFGKKASIAVTDIVATGADGYFVNVPNLNATNYSRVGFSVYSSGVTADGADSVLWAQGWGLGHNMNALTDMPGGGKIELTNSLMATGNDGGVGIEYVTSGGAGSITVEWFTILLGQNTTSLILSLVPNFAIKLKANTGEDSWTAGTLEVMPIGWR